jgi:hypothetical protein
MCFRFAGSKNQPLPLLPNGLINGEAPVGARSATHKEPTQAPNGKQELKPKS